MTEQTITVAGHFGDKQMTKDAFVKTWRDHVAQLKRLSWSMQWQEECSEMMTAVTAEADAEFDRLFAEQQGK